MWLFGLNVGICHLNLISVSDQSLFELHEESFGYILAFYLLYSVGKKKSGENFFPHLQVKDRGVIINWREQIKTADDHWVTYFSIGGHLCPALVSHLVVACFPQSEFRKYESIILLLHQKIAL